MRTYTLWQIIRICLLAVCSSSIYAIPSFDQQYRQWKLQQEQYDRQLMSTTASTPTEAASQGASTNQMVGQLPPAAQTDMSATSEKICVNQASMQQLQQLKGVGQKKAAAIITYRQQHGPFQHLEDLLLVKGLGEVFLEKNRKILCL